MKIYYQAECSIISMRLFRLLLSAGYTGGCRLVVCLFRNGVVPVYLVVEYGSVRTGRHVGLSVQDRRCISVVERGFLHAVRHV